MVEGKINQKEASEGGAEQHIEASQEHYGVSGLLVHSRNGSFIINFKGI